MISNAPSCLYSYCIPEKTFTETWYSLQLSEKSYWNYTTFTNFSMKYHLMCKVFTDVGGIKQLYHVCPPVRKIIHSLKLVDYLHVQADNPWHNCYITQEIAQSHTTDQPTLLWGRGKEQLTNNILNWEKIFFFLISLLTFKNISGIYNDF